jgi:hypothetical protein
MRFTLRLRHALLLFALAACGNGGLPQSQGDLGSQSGSDMASTSNPSAKCSTASDCRLYSSYCSSRPCVCLALERGAVDPPCLSGNQTCLVDPCLNKKPACDNSVCAVE